MNSGLLVVPLAKSMGKFYGTDRQEAPAAYRHFTVLSVFFLRSAAGSGGGPPFFSAGCRRR